MSDEKKMFAVQVFLRGMQGTIDLTYRSAETAQKVQEKITAGRAGVHTDTEHGTVVTWPDVDETDHFGRRLLCPGSDVMCVLVQDLDRDLSRQVEFAVKQAGAQARAQQVVAAHSNGLLIPNAVGPGMGVRN